jgi:Ca2+-binding EF-hand superfamily protein
MEISEFGWIFESIAESSQKLRKRIHDSKLVSFILASGTERAIDFFHRLDKHQSGILSLREFIFGMMELKLPPGITLKDVTKFAQVFFFNHLPPNTTYRCDLRLQAFDRDDDGTVSISEWSAFVRSGFHQSTC